MPVLAGHSRCAAALCCSQVLWPDLGATDTGRLNRHNRGKKRYRPFPGAGKTQRPLETDSTSFNRLGAAFAVPRSSGQIWAPPKPGG